MAATSGRAGACAPAIALVAHVAASYGVAALAGLLSSAILVL